MPLKLTVFLRARLYVRSYPAETIAPSLTQLAELCFRALRPVCHFHFAIHRPCDCELFLSATLIASATVHFAQAEVAVGDEWAHAAWLREGQSLAVIAFSVLGPGCGCDVTIEAKRVSLASPSPKAPCKRQCLLGVGGGLADLPERETGHPRAKEDESRPRMNLVSVELLDRSRDKRECLAGLAGERVGGTERCRE